MSGSSPLTISVNDTDFAHLCVEILDKGNSLRFAAQGSSMAPCIRNGEIITVAPASASDIKLGDVILYRTADNRITAHRMLGSKIGANGLFFRTGGDACIGTRESVSAGRLLGKVISVERKGRSCRLDGLITRLVSLLTVSFRRFARKVRRRIPMCRFERPDGEPGKTD